MTDIGKMTISRWRFRVVIAGARLLRFVPDRWHDHAIETLVGWAMRGVRTEILQ